MDNPEDGFLGTHDIFCVMSVRADLSVVPNLDLPAICSPKFRPGPPTDEAQVLSDRLNEILVSYVLFKNAAISKLIIPVQVWSYLKTVAVH